MDHQSAAPDTTLREEAEAARELATCLLNEQALLIAADVDALETGTMHKNALVLRMTALASQRLDRLASAGLPATKEGMQRWLEQVPALAESWRELQQYARQAQDINRTNGMLLNIHLTRNLQAINVLRQQPEGGDVYGPDGQRQLRAGARTLIVG